MPACGFSDLLYHRKHSLSEKEEDDDDRDINRQRRSHRMSRSPPSHGYSSDSHGGGDCEDIRHYNRSSHDTWSSRPSQGTSSGSVPGSRPGLAKIMTAPIYSSQRGTIQTSRVLGTSSTSVISTTSASLQTAAHIIADTTTSHAFTGSKVIPSTHAAILPQLLLVLIIARDPPQ